MFKLFSMLVVAGATALAGVDSAQACGGCSSAPTASAAPATAKAPSATAEMVQNGRQSMRRYSMAPGATTPRAPAMMYSRRSSGGAGWSASRKVLGY